MKPERVAGLVVRFDASVDPETVGQAFAEARRLLERAGFEVQPMPSSWARKLRKRPRRRGRPNRTGGA